MHTYIPTYIYAISRGEQKRERGFDTLCIHVRYNHEVCATVSPILFNLACTIERTIVLSFFLHAFSFFTFFRSTSFESLKIRLHESYEYVPYVPRR